MTEGNANTSALLKRAFMFLEDGDWDSANNYCEKILDLDPENTQAYLGKLMAELQVKKQEDLKNCPTPFDRNINYIKTIRFSDQELTNTLIGYIEHINARNRENSLSAIYSQAQNKMRLATSEAEYKKAADIFATIHNYRDASALVQECLDKAENARKDAILSDATSKMVGSVLSNYEVALRLLESIPGWNDADTKVSVCRDKIEELTAKAKVEQEQAALRAKKNKKIAMIVAPILGVIIIFVIILNTVIIPNNKYNDAIALMEAGEYFKAITVFESLDEYKDSRKKISECYRAMDQAKLDKNYNNAIKLMEEGKYTEAISIFEAIDGHKDSKTKKDECETAIKEEKYNAAIALMTAEKYEEAISIFETIDEHKDSKTKKDECKTAIKEAKYNEGIAEMNAGHYKSALTIFASLNGHKDSQSKIAECRAALNEITYNEAIALMEAGKYEEAIVVFEGIRDYKDSADKISKCNTNIKESKYKNAVSLMNKGDYSGAISAFSALNGYKDSAAKITQCDKNLKSKSF